jgi:dihydrofolate synthase/folylpolyglutamate synthase
VKGYEETLSWLYAQLPMFTRIGAAAYKPNLDNTIRLLDSIGNPQRQLSCIHIAGTNGKGSTSNMLAAVLQAAGYKTGLYTSPHLVDFRERIRINGQMIPKEFIVEFTAKHQQLFEEVKPSFFEMTVGLCFAYFAQEKVEIAVIETGLGGRLDSTNVIEPVLSIITNIGYDHMYLLGDTLPKIASEKAGIIKKNIPVVIGESSSETDSVFIDKAESMGSPIVFADRTLSIIEKEMDLQRMIVDVLQENKIWLKDLEVSLCGNYQKKNLATVLQSVLSLKERLTFPEEKLRYGLSHICELTGFAGRWQVMQKQPLAILDTGHNAHGISQTMSQLNSIQHNQLHIVFGVVADKSLDDIIKHLPGDANYYLCSPNLPRALEVSKLAEAFSASGKKYTVYTSVTAAWNAALSCAKKEDIVFAGGSTFVVGEILAAQQAAS